jgi:hypothetical protein
MLREGAARAVLVFGGLAGLNFGDLRRMGRLVLTEPYHCVVELTGGSAMVGSGRWCPAATVVGFGLAGFGLAVDGRRRRGFPYFCHWALRSVGLTLAWRRISDSWWWAPVFRLGYLLLEARLVGS